MYVTELKMIAVKSFPYYFIHWNPASKTVPDSVRICKSSCQTFLLLIVIYLYFRPLWGRNFAEQFLNEASLLNEHAIVQNTRKSTIEWAKLWVRNMWNFYFRFHCNPDLDFFTDQNIEEYKFFLCLKNEMYLRLCQM